MPALASNQAGAVDVAAPAATLRNENVPNSLNLEAVRRENP